MFGNATVRRFRGSLTIAKDAVAANTVAFVALDLGTSPALAVGDVVMAVPQSDPTNLLIGPGRVKDADEVLVPICNPTAGALPAAAFTEVFDLYVFTATGTTLPTT